MDEAFSIGRGEGHIKVRISMYVFYCLVIYIFFMERSVTSIAYLGLSDAF